MFPGEYKFVGDGAFTIGNLNPDFVNINGQKKAIEFFGEPYHDPKKAIVRVRYESTEEGRKKIFNDFGFQLMVVWGLELKEKRRKELESKLVEFHHS